MALKPAITREVKRWGLGYHFFLCLIFQNFSGKSEMIPSTPS